MKTKWTGNTGQRKWFTFVLTFCMIVGLMTAMPVYAEDSGESQSITFDIRIVETNDIHARIEENAKSGLIGMDRLSGIIKSFTEGADGSLVLDGGDTFHGQSIATVVKGESVARLMKACGYDAMTPGNHDWSYGKDRLKELGEMSGLEMLAGNVVNEDGTPFFENDSYIKEVTKDGKTLKIGVFGVIDPSLYKKTTPSNVAGLKFTDAEAYANEEAAKLRQEGCDLVIALSHTYDPEELASQVDGVNLWICGHEHIQIDSSVTTPDGSTAYVYESGYYLNEAGLINLNCTVDEQGEVSITSSRTLVDYAQSLNYEKDPAVTELINTIYQENETVLSREVGETPVTLDGEWVNLRIDQTNLGNVVTDAYLKVTGADIAFENAGGIRATVEAGKVTYGDIIGVSPYGNYIVTKKLTGKQIKDILEISIGIQQKSVAANDSGDTEAWPKNSGSYLQVGGITVEYDPALEEGNRVLSVKVGDQNLDENREYTVAMNNYMAVSSNYPEMAATKEDGEFSACDEALIAFFEQGKDAVAASVDSTRMIQTTKKDTSGEEIKKPETEDKKGTEAEDKKDTETEDKKGTEAEAKKDTEEIKKTSSPKTADTASFGIWIMLMLLSGGVVTVYSRVNHTAD